jgi:hypothetical protein
MDLLSSLWMPYNAYKELDSYVFFAQCAANECIMGRSHLSVHMLDLN